MTASSPKAWTRPLQARIRGRMTSPTNLMVAAGMVAAGIGFLLGKRGSNRSRTLLAPLKVATNASLLFRALMPNATAVTEPVQQP